MRDNGLPTLIKKYQNNGGRPVNFNFKEAYNALQNSNNNNVNYHYIHFYPGRIYPYIPQYILSLSDLKHMDGVLLDPFAGSGTILLESIINPIIRRGSWGAEINPIGRLISKVKSTIFDLNLIPRYMEELHKTYSAANSVNDLIPVYENIEMWFSKETISKLSKLRYAIENLEAQSDIKDFFWLCFSSIIRRVSKADPYIPPPVILKIERYKHTQKFDKLKDHLQRAESPNLWGLFKETAENNRKKLSKIFENFGENSAEGKIIWDDAREIKIGILRERGFIDRSNSKRLPKNTIDIVFTSPPYLTAQKYIRTSKLELLWLGYTVEEIKELEKKSIGTERTSISNNEQEELGFDDIDKLIEITSHKSKQRALMVHLYFKNMIKAIDEMHRVLKNGGYLVLVIGDNKVLGKWIGTYRLLADIAVNKNFKELVILKDRIKSRSMMTKRNGSGGLIKNEYVVILKKEG